ncbi:Mu-like prophage major head subunit gpT family protein [Luteimicrobium sp. NPDC057192]|uniref:phage major capsid protein n=1 Tax=Luteimicrobium sp. NPDC057192 TaxID=3346042 RepID=UPI003629307D
MSTSTLPRNRRILEARRLFEAAMAGDLRARAEIQETLTTSDFPNLLGSSFQRELLTGYQAIQPVWQQFARRSTVRDFRKQTLVDILGGRAGLDKVKQATEYPARKLTEGKYDFQVDKYGARIPLTWEMLINDDLGAFEDLADRLATAARETEERLAVTPLFNAAKTGLNTSFFTGVAAPGTAALTADSLEAALLNISTRKDSDGRPVVIQGGVLMVPPALEFTAKRILNASEIRTTTDNTTSIEPNLLAGSLSLVVNPWLPVVAASDTLVNKTWFVLPNPSAARPALTVGFLRGHENPDLRVKADTGNSVGGGAISPEDGSFDDDTIQYRVRHVTGAAALINTAAYASVPAS